MKSNTPSVSKSLLSSFVVVALSSSLLRSSDRPSRLGRSSPYDMDLLPVSVGGAGVRCLLLLSSSLSVGVFQFWSFGLGLGGYVGCGHRCTCSTQVPAVGVWFLLGFRWSMTQGFAPLRWRVCGVVTDACGAKGLWICQPSPLNLCGGVCSVVQCWSQDLGFGGVVFLDVLLFTK
ncbi:unnamed protein product [Brassica oleracea var. botrytis]|uniref:(rape) hypothetical protein n=1 Tax=Brassica napus TaxID=3708 RepID=A0A816UHG2_BRANA|nr:unnamed protein product [Brassica napus]